MNFDAATMNVDLQKGYSDGVSTSFNLDCKGLWCRVVTLQCFPSTVVKSTCQHDCDHFVNRFATKNLLSTETSACLSWEV